MKSAEGFERCTKQNAVDANTVHARFLEKLASQKFLFVYSKYITIPLVAVGFGGGRGFAYAPSKKIP